MNIQSISSSNQNSPVFKGYIGVKLGFLPEKLRPAVIKAVKQEIGEGLVTRNISLINRKGIKRKSKQQIFVGFDYCTPAAHDWFNRISISTGDDMAIRTEKGKKYSGKKIGQVDKQILETINKIFKRIGINEPKNFIEAQIDTISRIGKFEVTSPGWVTTDVYYNRRLAEQKIYVQDSDGEFEHYRTEKL